MDTSESLEVAQKKKDLIEISIMRKTGKSKGAIRKFIAGARVRASLARLRDNELIKARKIYGRKPATKKRPRR